MPLRYLSTLDLPDAWFAELARRCPDLDVRRVPARSPAEVPAAAWAEVEVLHTDTVLPDPGTAPALRWVQLNTSGAEHAAASALWGSSVAVTTIGGIAPVPMAEFAVMSLLSLAHHMPLVAQRRAARAWPPAESRLADYTPLPVDGTTTTIVGYGRIGREIARLLTVLGMHVIGVNRTGRQEQSADYAEAYYSVDRSALSPGYGLVEVLPTADLDKALARSEYVVVTVPRTPATTGLIDAERLAALPAGACLVDVARGGVVDERALLAALESGHVRYAALDVFEQEPLAHDSVWWDHPRVQLTPHVAGLAPRYAEQVLDLVCRNVERYLAGRPLMNQVNRAEGY